jgi:uncharacterized protein
MLRREAEGTGAPAAPRGGEPPSTTPEPAPGRVLEVLGEAECLRLLGTPPVGRLISTEGALPTVLLLPFVVRGGEVLACAPADLAARATRNGVVLAFEVDHHDTTTTAWWTVTTVGASRLVTDAEEAAALDALGLRAWVPAAEHCHLAIAAELLRGHRVTALPPGDRTRSGEARR